MRTEHRKYLRFEHDGQLYEFVCLPNGPSYEPRIFTKLLKPALARLRDDGVLLVDDPQTLVTHILKAPLCLYDWVSLSMRANLFLFLLKGWQFWDLF